MCLSSTGCKSGPSAYNHIGCQRHTGLCLREATTHLIALSKLQRQDAFGIEKVKNAASLHYTFSKPKKKKLFELQELCLTSTKSLNERAKSNYRSVDLLDPLCNNEKENASLGNRSRCEVSTVSQKALPSCAVNAFVLSVRILSTTPCSFDRLCCSFAMSSSKVASMLRNTW